MKTVKYLVIYLSLLIQSILSLNAQTTEGKEFWLTFGYSEALSALPVTDFTIRIVTENLQTTGYIYFKALGTYEPFTINPFEVYTYHLNEAQKIAAYNTTMGVSNKSIYIYSTNPVSVYSGALRAHNSDVTNVLPLTALNREYYQISYRDGGVESSDAYAVVATQNNTQLFHNNILEATLQAGEVYYRTDISDISDMTGAHITSNHPIAFFAVNQSAQIPYFSMNPYSRLYQQLAPVNTWGKTFFVPVTLHQYNIVRIVASQNNTYITQTGGMVQNIPGAQTDLTNLQAGEFVELRINAVDSGCFILANKPVAVCSYLPVLTGIASAPSQSWIPGKEQTVTHALIASFQYTIGIPLISSYALIATSTATRDNTKVSINGALPKDLNGGVWKGNKDAGMSYYSMPLTDDNASYSFTNQKGMIILGYGVPLSGIFASYYYLAYSAMRDLDAVFYANDVHFQDLKDTLICENKITFRAEIENMGVQADSLRWYINGEEELSARDQTTWSKTFAGGEYEIKMWVRFENNDTISKTGTLKICDSDAVFYANNIHYATLYGQTICDANIFNFRAEIEGLHFDEGSLKWFINGSEHLPARDQQQWTYNYFPNGTYTVEMKVRYANDTIETISSTFIIYVGGFIKLRNIRH